MKLSFQILGLLLAATLFLISCGSGAYIEPPAGASWGDGTRNRVSAKQFMEERASNAPRAQKKYIVGSNNIKVTGVVQKAAMFEQMYLDDETELQTLRVPSVYLMVQSDDEPDDQSLMIFLRENEGQEGLVPYEKGLRISMLCQLAKGTSLIPLNCDKVQ